MDADIVIIGGGPAGYRAAERAGQRFENVVLIEEQEIGGVCLNAGCIPTKTLLHSAKLYELAANSARFGVTAESVSYDLGAAMSHKRTTIDALVKGVRGSLKRHGVKLIQGRAQLVDRRTVAVGSERITADAIIIATGSSSAAPPIPGLEALGADGSPVLTSTELLEIAERPRRLAIIGGGYIGMEFASYFSAVGTEVHVIEMMEEIIPFLDPEISQTLRTGMQGVTFHLGCKVERVDGGTVHFSAGGTADSVEADLVLVAIGRRPNVAEIGLQEAGVEFDRLGIRVDEQMRSNLPGVYAAGDVTGRSLLAHSAYRMAEVAVADIVARSGKVAGAAAGDGSIMRYGAIPWVVFTAPEVAGVGMDEKQAREAGLDPVTVNLSMKASGRYLAEHPSERGFVKMIANRSDRRILGVQMIGTGCSELVFGVATAIETELRVDDLREVIFPHPTMSEVLRDAAWALNTDE